MTLAIELGTQRDAFRDPDGLGAHEWWYFDLHDPSTDLGAVIIFFRGIPFSGARQRATMRARRGDGVDRADDFPAVAFSLYDRRGTKLYLANVHRREDLMLGEERTSIRVGRSTASLAGGVYRITLRERLLDGRDVSVDATFESVTPPVPSAAVADRAAHLWIASAPRCRASIDVAADGEHFTLSGSGYHDHNVGLAGLPDQFRSWEWGRAHFARETLVYYASESTEGERDARLLRADDDGLVLDRSVVDARTTARNLYGVRHGRELSVRAAGRTLEVSQRRIVDNGPFYLRFLSEFRSDDGETATGFSEVLRPAALRWRWFWPLLDSRVRHVDSGDRVGRQITQWLIQKGF